MLQDKNLNSVMETRDHSKNGASLKSLMSKINQITVFAIIAILCFCCFSCNKDESENNQDGQIIEYKGELPNPELFLWEDGIDAFMVNAYPGFVGLYSTNSKIKTLVKDYNGNIVEQIPDYGYYLVKVDVGNENNFAKNMHKEGNTLCCPHFYLKANSQTIIMDKNEKISDNLTHKEAVNDVYEKCSGKTAKNKNANGYASFALNFRFTGESNGINLFNYSIGADPNGVSIEDYRKNYKKFIQERLELMYLAKTSSIAKRNNFVLVMAAGNDEVKYPIGGIDDIVEEIRTENPKYSDVIDNHFLLVTNEKEYAHKPNSSKPYIASVPEAEGYAGTSFSAPLATCYLDKTIDAVKEATGKELTAKELMEVVGETITANNGTLDESKVIEAALKKYASNGNNNEGQGNLCTINGNWSGWQKGSFTTSVSGVPSQSSPIDGEFGFVVENCKIQAGSYQVQGMSMSFSGSMTGNNVKIYLTTSGSGINQNFTYTGQLNAAKNKISGTWTLSASYSMGGVGVTQSGSGTWEVTK